MALLNLPWAWIGVERKGNAYTVEEHDFTTGKSATAALAGPRVWLRVHCNFDTEISTFRYSTDGKDFKPLGDEFITVFQLTTFQGVRIRSSITIRAASRAATRISIALRCMSRGRAG